MNMGHERITADDSIMSAIVKMSDGNPCGVVVMREAALHAEEIEPMAIMGGFAPLLSLDTLGVYGSRIWMLYKNVCKEHLPTMLAVLRAWQLGGLSADKLDHAIDHYGEGIDLDVVKAAVKERLPEFNLEWSPTT
jgi:hypothetical protein